MGKIICAPARYSPYKAAYQIWSPLAQVVFGAIDAAMVDMTSNDL